ncbi:MAG TPA: FAD-dependent oxidoreductase [Coleofasciculaceae cyanobacterium]|jgi:phytoene dehydrogenase-like protein
MQVYDVVMIGAGHNGLVCAAYLLKAGYSVLLLEKNSVPGGGATTEESLPQEAPGFKFNPCAIDHIFTTPIEGLYLTGAGTHPGGAISGMPGRNCARVFLQQQHPVRERLAEAANSLKSTAKSVLNMHH